MTPAQVLVLGGVQGVSEFLPISSSAHPHLILLPWLMGWSDQGLTFDVVLHAGTLIAILSFFWQDWYEMATSFLRRDKSNWTSSKLLLLVVTATIPGALAGFLAQKTIETTLRSPFILSVTLIGVALLLWQSCRRLNRRGRSGARACARNVSIGNHDCHGLFRGLTRQAAARFSFLLSAPITGGAVLKKCLDLRHSGVPDADRVPMVLGFLSSLLFGYLTIRFLMHYLQRNTLGLFVVYRISLGFVILGLIVFAGFRP